MTAEEIIQRLLDEKHITFHEALILSKGVEEESGVHKLNQIGDKELLDEVYKMPKHEIKHDEEKLNDIKFSIYRHYYDGGVSGPWYKTTTY